MTEPLLVVRDLEAGYGEMPVLRGIGFEIREREIVALVGSNAAGRTPDSARSSVVLPAACRRTGSSRWAWSRCPKGASCSAR